MIAVRITYSLLALSINHSLTLSLTLSLITIVQTEWLEGINTHIRYLRELTDHPTVLAKYQAELKDYNERHNISQ